MKKPIKIAAIAGIILIALSIISGIVSGIFKPDVIKTNVALKEILSLISILEYISSIFFTYGFVVLGRKFKSRLLVVMSWIFIAIAILFLVLGFLGMINNLVKPVSAQGDFSTSVNGLKNIDQNNFNWNNLTLEQQYALIFILLIAWIIFSLILGVLNVLYGIGIINLGPKVRYSKATGILNIVAGATFIIIIGIFIYIAAFIMEILLLFDASKRLEK